MTGDTLTIALAQCNPTVGDVGGNLARARAARAEAAAAGAELVVFSETFLSGYPAEDLVLKPMFLEAIRTAAEDLAGDTADGGPGVLIGAPWVEGDLDQGPLRGGSTMLPCCSMAAKSNLSATNTICPIMGSLTRFGSSRPAPCRGPCLFVVCAWG